MRPPICVVVACIALWISACATAGHDLDFSRLDDLKVGVSTFEDARRLFGEPTSMAEGPHGGHAYGWSYAHSNGFSGQMSGKAIMLTFANTGKLLTKSSAAQGARVD